jgi:hypothetical protein
MIGTRRLGIMGTITEGIYVNPRWHLGWNAVAGWLGMVVRHSTVIIGVLAWSREPEEPWSLGDQNVHILSCLSV